MFFLLVGAQRMNIHLQNRFYVRQDSSFRIPFPGHRHGSALGRSWKSSFKPSKYDERMYLWYFFSTPACIYIYTYTSCKTKQTSDDPLYLRSCSRVANASARFSPGTSLSWGSSIGWRSVFLQETSLLTLWPSHIATKHLSLNGMLMG